MLVPYFVKPSKTLNECTVLLEGNPPSSVLVIDLDRHLSHDMRPFLDLLVRLLVLLVLDHAKPADLVVGKSLCFLWSSSLSSLVSILRITQPVAISVTVTSFASIASDVDTRSPNVVPPFRETNRPSVGLPTCGRRWRDSSLCYCQPCEGYGETFTCPYCVTDLSTSFMFNCSTTLALSYPT